MCDTATTAMIETVVEDFVRTGTMFTAWDVTQKVRRKGIRERHGEIKKVVHGLFENGTMDGYVRAVVPLPNQPAGQQPPFVYHLAGQDPTDYAIQQSMQVQAQATPPAVQAQVADDDAEDDDDGVSVSADGHYRVDARQTLCVPKQLISALGLAPGEEVGVYVEPSGLVVTKEPAGPGVLTTYTVDKNGNVRVTQGILQRAGLAGTIYGIEGDATRVVITLVCG